MNELNRPDHALDSPWLQGDPLMQEPDTQLLPDAEAAEPVAVDLLNHAVQGAHNTLDRLADSAAPVVQQLSESVTAAEDSLHAKTDQYRETRDEWIESVRTTVRGNPLAAVAAALMLGAVIARITR